MSKKYFIKTYGCQANLKDSQIMAGLLNRLGFIPTKNYKNADVIILNSCSVRQKSEDKLTGWGIKKTNFQKKAIVIVTGCFVGSAMGVRRRISKKVLTDKMPWAKYYLSPDEEERIPDILIKDDIAKKWALDITNFRNIATNPTLENSTKWAYVNISTGCDNFCTFCVVPYARGKEISRAEEEILIEVRDLVSRGYRNIMLIGQNINSWNLDNKSKFALRAGSKRKIPFAELLRSVHGVPKVEKISFLSSNPFDFTQNLIDTLTLPKIDKYLHIAVQSGNNEILKKMNRRHTIEEFKKLIMAIKKKIPDMTFGTDVIVGFPSETKEQFMDTVRLFEEIKFNVAFISVYSARPGTVSEKTMKDDIPLKEKKRRHAYLTKVWKQSLK